MNDVIKLLNRYFAESDIEELLQNVESKNRSIIINDKYFAKMCVNDSSLFCNNFINEINLYKKNSNNSSFPNLIDSLINKKYCLLILKKINSKTIGTSRNNFNVRLSYDKKISIIDSILKIKNIHIDFDLDNSYNRDEKFTIYLDKSKRYLSKYTINKLNNYKKTIVKEEYERVLAHGDLISTNIMVDKNNVYFLDWEYVSLKPLYYDLAYFLLFSKTNNCFNIIDNIKLTKIAKKEVYKDGVIICLKEIQNNAKLYGVIDEKIINKNINRWKRELNRLLRYL